MITRKAFLLGLGAGTLASFVILANDFLVNVSTSVFHPGAPTALIDPLYPPGRWTAPSHGTQTLIADPGYTDIYIPKGTDLVTVKIEYENPSEQKFALGFRAPTGPKLVTVSGKQGWFTAFFAVSEMQLIDGRMGLIFSAPELRIGNQNPIVIKTISVLYERY